MTAPHDSGATIVDGASDTLQRVHWASSPLALRTAGSPPCTVVRDVGGGPRRCRPHRRGPMIGTGRSIGP